MRYHRHPSEQRSCSDESLDTESDSCTNDDGYSNDGEASGASDTSADARARSNRSAHDETTNACARSNRSSDDKAADAGTRSDCRTNDCIPAHHKSAQSRPRPNRSSKYCSANCSNNRPAQPGTGPNSRANHFAAKPGTRANSSADN